MEILFVPARALLAKCVDVKNICRFMSLLAKLVTPLT